MGQYVYTDRGRGWVYRAQSLVRSGGILIPYEDVKLRLPEGERGKIEAGTPLVRNRKLARDTRKKSPDDRRTHLVFDEGIHSLERGFIHAQRFEREDAKEMLMRSPQMEQVAKDLYVCGQLSFEDHARITSALQSIRASFSEFKKADRKIETRRHIDTADAQRSKVGRFKAMPASAAAFASRRDIQARFQEATQIHAAFGTNALRVHELMDEVFERFDVAWNFFQPDGGANGLPRDISYAMARDTRSRSAVRLADGQLRERAEILGEVYVLPYLPMARLVCADIRVIATAIDGHRRKAVLETVDRVRATLRRMRMLWYVETRLIRILSFPSTSSSGPAYQPQTIEAFKKRLAAAKARVNDMKDVEFDPALRQLVRDHLVAAENGARHEHFEDARDVLKRLTHELRVRPVTSGRQAA